MPPVTLKEVAELARVSTGTASFALRGVRKLKPETVARVRAAAQELGYLANPVAAALRNSRGAEGGGSGLSVAVLFMRACQNEQVLRRLVAKGRRLGHFTTARVVKSAKELRQFEREWKMKGGDGVVFLSGYCSHDVVDEASRMSWSRYGVVKIGNGMPSLRVNQVRHSAFREAWEVFERVTAAGYRRIGFYAMVSASPSDDHARVGAALAFQREWAEKGGVVVLRCLQAGESIEDRVDRVRRWLEEDRLEVVIGFPGGYLHYLLTSGGCRIPQDMPFAGLPVDWHKMQERVSGCYEDIVEQSFPVALQMLTVQLARGERGVTSLVHEHVLQPEWTAGVTLPVRPAMAPK